MEKEEYTIDIRMLWSIFVQHIRIIILATLVSALIGFSISAFLVPKKYTSEALLYVVNNTSSSDSININDITASQKLVETCQIIFKSQYMLNLVKEQVGDSWSTGAINRAVTILPVNSTEVLSIKAVTSDPNTAMLLANKFVELAPAEFLRVVKTGSIEVVSEATFPAGPSFPSIPMFSMIGLLIGLFGSYFLMLLIEMFDIKVKDTDNLTQIYNVPVFGEIMDFQVKNLGAYSYEQKG